MGPPKGSNQTKRCRGVVVPMVTPLTPAGELDEPAAGRIIEHLLAGGVHGVFVLGTTGEMPSLPGPIRRRLAALTVQRVGGRARTYAGIADNCLDRAVGSAEEFFGLGIDAVVAHLPSYYVLDPREQEDYFAALLDRLAGPAVLYNIPATTGMSIPVEAVERLSAHRRAVALKDSESDPSRFRAVLKALGGREDFAVLCGATRLSTQALFGGADGTVPSAGNLVPATCAAVYERALAGDRPGAERLQAEVDAVAATYQRGRSLGQALAALKAAMSVLGLCGPTMMPPLRTLDADGQRRVREELGRLGMPGTA